MNFSEEWRFLRPVTATNSSHAPPLLPRAAAFSSVGPLQLQPIPETQKSLLTFESLSPPSLPPLPSLSLPKFIQVFSSAPPSTSASISGELPSGHIASLSSSFVDNRLEPLLFPDGRSTLAFFPTGDNLDRVGFVLLTVTDSQLRVKGDVFMSSNSIGHRIVQLAASAAVAVNDDNADCVGFLMASTAYSVHWFRVSLAAQGTKHECPILVYLGNKLFKSASVARVCWSPHLSEESLVLLESGQLFLFDVDAGFKGKRVPVSWDEHCGSVHVGGWLWCEFSWHRRVMIVANRDAVFLVDCRFGKSSVKCLMRVGLLSQTDFVKTDQFVAFGKAGSDGFYYAVASKCWLALVDIRVPCKPVLQWMHYHQNPCHVSVFSLSTLRGNLGSDEFNRASKMGYGIVLGSFWTGEFSLFCYGPSLSSLKQPVSSNKAFEVSNPVYAWDLPSELSLSGLHCPCSNCLVQEEFAKDELPEWVDWQQKKQLALGYIVLDKALYSLLSDADGDGAGFMLVRLMSSGKLESHRYNACFDMPKKVESAHVGSTLVAKDFHLCSTEEEYKFQVKFKYVRLKYLYAYAINSLTDVLFTKIKKMHEGVGGRKRLASSISSHDFIFKKIKTCGLINDGFKDICQPTSICEVASKKLWTTLPTSILGMAFSTYKECFEAEVNGKKVFLDFTSVSDQNQAHLFTLQTPSNRSNKWSKRVKPGDEIVGPVIPLPISLTFKEISENGYSHIEKVNQFSAASVVKHESRDVLRVTREMCVCRPDIDNDDYSVSLGNDSLETWGMSSDKRFHLYTPSSFLDDVCNHPDSARYTTMVANVADGGSELFDDTCPIPLNFKDSVEWNIGSKELHAFAVLNAHIKKQQHKFRPYADLCGRLKR